MKRRCADAGIVVALACCLTIAAGEESSRFDAEITGFNLDGVLFVKVGFHFDEPKTVYSWRGHLDPLLGYALKVRFENTGNLELRAEQLPRLIPKLPHPSDVAVGYAHSYPTLTFKIVDSEGRPFHGCVEFVLIYDTTEKASYEKVGLDLLKLETKPLRACNDTGR